MLTTSLSASFFIGCHALRSPNSEDSVEDNRAGRGTYMFHRAGDDSTARRLAPNPGRQVLEGRTGGPGELLQIVGPTGGMVLIRAYNLFNLIPQEGWTGETPNRVRIGTMRSEFARLYPRFTVIRRDRFELRGGTRRVSVTFDDEFLSNVDVRVLRLTDVHVGITRISV